MSKDSTASSKALLAIDNATEIVLHNVRPFSTLQLPLTHALLHTLAEPVSTDIDQPPFDRSLMDGYAVRAADTQSPPVTLQIVGQIAAGTMPKAPVAPGQAMQINTGAPVPSGADAVVRVEATKTMDAGASVQVLESVKTGQFITPCGEYRKAGEIVLHPGMLLTPVNIG